MNRLAEMEALVAVVESGSFTAAAERLGANKSIVSRRVSQLEKRLGVRLLSRTTRRLSLTESGQRYYQQVTVLLADLEEVENGVMHAAGELRGRIRLAAPLSFGLKHLSPALGTFLRQHPAIELDLDLNDREVNLVEEGFDMALRIGELVDSTLVAKRIGRVRMLVCASGDYLQEYGEPRQPRDLKQHLGLQYSNVSYRSQWTFSEGPRELFGQPQIRMRANNGDMLAAAAAAGLGIVAGPSFILADYIRRGELVQVLSEFERPGTGLHAVFPPGRMTPRRILELAGHLKGRFGENPYWDAGVFAET